MIFLENLVSPRIHNFRQLVSVIILNSLSWAFYLLDGAKLLLLFTKQSIKKMDTTYIVKPSKPSTVKLFVYKRPPWKPAKHSHVAATSTYAASPNPSVASQTDHPTVQSDWVPWPLHSAAPSGSATATDSAASRRRALSAPPPPSTVLCAHSTGTDCRRTIAPVHPTCKTVNRIHVSPSARCWSSRRGTIPPFRMGGMVPGCHPVHNKNNKKPVLLESGKRARLKGAYLGVLIVPFLLGWWC